MSPEKHGHHDKRRAHSAVRHLVRAQREVNQKLVLSSLRAHEAVEAAENASRELRASEEQLRTLADTLPLLAWYAEPDGHVTWYNRRWFEYTGTSLREQEGWKWSSVQDPGDLPRIVARWRASLASGEPWEDEFRLRRHDGELRWFLGRAVALRDADGRIVRWFGTNMDVDDQKQAEAAARRRGEVERAELATRLATELATAELRERLLGILGHDLRNPLNAMTMGAGMLVSRGHLAEEDRGVVLRILNGAQRMNRMIVQLLDFTRARLGGGLLLECGPMDLGEVCRGVAEELTLGTGVTVQLTADGDLTGSWDADRLAEVVSNIAGNAIEHARAGTHAAIHARGDGADVVVVIRNEGSPIPPDVLPFIFEPFRRARQREISKAGNLGLGLYIALEITRAHGGTLDACSADGATAFTMRLPRCPAPPPSSLPGEGLTHGA